MSEWIDVKERLPPYGVIVLVVFRGVVQNVAYFRDIGEWVPCSSEGDAAPDGTFSHWQPLPEPPKETP